MAQNGPKMVVNQKFLENGSNDFPDFWPEVGGQYSKKVDPAGFFPKNPVFLDSGLTVPKRPKNLFFEIWSIYIVIIYENEALGLEKNKKIYLASCIARFWNHVVCPSIHPRFRPSHVHIIHIAYPSSRYHFIASLSSFCLHIVFKLS